MSKGRRARLVLDSNVLTGGIVTRWGLDRAVLSLCASRVCQLVLAEAVRDEVEENILLHVESLDPGLAGQLLDDYSRLIKLTRPEIIPFPSEAEVVSSRHIIRHAADVPVLLSAIKSVPDWLLTHNTKHFSPAVSRRTRLRIATPVDFFQALSQRIS